MTRRSGGFKFGRFVPGRLAACRSVPLSCPDCCPTVRRVPGCRAASDQSRDTDVTRRRAVPTCRSTRRISPVVVNGAVVGVRLAVVDAWNWPLDRVSARIEWPSDGLLDIRALCGRGRRTTGSKWLRCCLLALDQRSIGFAHSREPELQQIVLPSAHGADGIRAWALVEHQISTARAGIQIRLVDPFVDGAVRGGVRASVDREVHLECSRAQRMPEGDVRPLNRSDLRQHIKRQPQLVERKIVPILVDADELDSGKSARARSRSALVLSHDSARSESAIVPYSLSLRLGTTIAEPRDRIRTDATYVRDCRGSHHWCSCADYPGSRIICIIWDARLSDDAEG